MIALLIVVIGGVTLTHLVKGKAKGVFAMVPVAESVEKVAAGLEDYEKDHNGQYPPTLDALVPKYVADKSAFICGEGDSQKPMEYTPPKPDAAEGFVVIRVHTGDLSMVSTQVQKMYVCLQKNGQVVSEQDAITILSKPGKRMSDRRSY